MTFSTDQVTLSPSAIAQTFTLSVYATNTSASSVTFAGFDADYVFSPAIQSGQIQVTSVQFPSTPSFSNFSEVGPGDYLTTSAYETGSSGAATYTLAMNQVMELVRLNLQLAPNAIQSKYTVSFDVADLNDINGNPAANVTVVNGFVATPEPSSLIFVGGLTALTLRRRRAARTTAAV